MTVRFSLRTRLVGLTLLAVASIWLLTAFVTWREARHELEELLAHPPSTTATHLAHEREEAAREIAGQLLKPMLVALPALALLLVVAIGFALKPLRQLAHDVATRAPDRLDQLSSDSLPAEIAPLVNRLNSLFADISRALENERRFTADAAHELRTPLAALKAQAQVALASTDAAERSHALNQLIAACDRATHLVAQLLTLARLDAPNSDRKRSTSLRQIAAETLAMSAGDAVDRKYDLILRDGDADVQGDPLLLQVMLRNLVDNALRHSGGTRIEISIAQHDGRAVLAVSDNGRGISEDERERVQRRFYRGAGSDSSGSGLGLSIVRRIVELHAGRMDIAAPASGGGTSLLVSLPLAGGRR